MPAVESGGWVAEAQVLRVGPQGENQGWLPWRYFDGTNATQILVETQILPCSSLYWPQLLHNHCLQNVGQESLTMPSWLLCSFSIEGMATHSNVLAWRIPWTEEPGRLRYIGLQRVRHNWSNLARMHTHRILEQIQARARQDLVWTNPTLPTTGPQMFLEILEGFLSRKIDWSRKTEESHGHSYHYHSIYFSSPLFLYCPNNVLYYSFNFNFL